METDEAFFDGFGSPGSPRPEASWTGKGFA